MGRKNQNPNMRLGRNSVSGVRRLISETVRATVIRFEGIAKPICKKTAAPPPNSGKDHYLKRLNHASRSAPWKYSRATTEGRHGGVSHDAGESTILLSYPATELSEEPSGYERRNRTGKFNNNRHFRAGSLTFVPVWLRRFIGYSLVEYGPVNPAPSRLRPPSPQSCKGPEVPSHGRGRRFNPYNAHHWAFHRGHVSPKKPTRASWGKLRERHRKCSSNLRAPDYEFGVSSSNLFWRTITP